MQLVSRPNLLGGRAEARLHFVSPQARSYASTLRQTDVGDHYTIHFHDRELYRSPPNVASFLGGLSNIAVCVNVEDLDLLFNARIAGVFYLDLLIVQGPMPDNRDLFRIAERVVLVGRPETMAPDFVICPLDGKLSDHPEVLKHLLVGMKTSSDHAAFERAVTTGLSMRYQAIKDVRTGDVVSFEALVRSTEPGFEGAVELIAMAERMGSMQRLERRIRDRVAAEGVLPRLSVNLCPSNLDDPHLFDPASPLSRMASRVTLELTESRPLTSVMDLPSRITQLRRMGFEVALDDVGAGHAGLLAILKVNPDTIKLDMHLVRGIDQNLLQQRVVASLQRLADDLGAKLVGEGVETPEESSVLADLGVYLQQGFLHGKPVGLRELCR